MEVLALDAGRYDELVRKLTSSRPRPALGVVRDFAFVPSGAPQRR